GDAVAKVGRLQLDPHSHNSDATGGARAGGVPTAQEATSCLSGRILLTTCAEAERTPARPRRLPPGRPAAAPPAISLPRAPRPRPVPCRSVPRGGELHGVPRPSAPRAGRPVESHRSSVVARGNRPDSRTPAHDAALTRPEPQRDARSSRELVDF